MLVGDVRAATPTHAAQLLWTEKRELAQRIDEGATRLDTAWRHEYMGEAVGTGGAVFANLQVRKITAEERAGLLAAQKAR